MTVQIFSETAGPKDAPLIVLIHGTMDRSAGLLRLSRRLDQQFRVLRYDRRGYGRSVPPNSLHPGPFTMADQVGDLVDLLQGRRCLAVGHSYGGNVALSLATRHPDLVGGVAIYETPLSWEPWWPGTTAGAEARSMTGSPGDAVDHFMRRLVGAAKWDALPERTRAARRCEGAAMVGELGDLHENRPWEADAIRCPLVIGLGSKGVAHHQRGMRYLRSVVAHSRLVELSGCAHDAPNSHSHLFADCIVVPLAHAAGDPWAAAVSPTSAT